MRLIARRSIGNDTIAVPEGVGMEFKGDVTINAPREKVWAFLIDPHQVTQCAPGLQSVEVVDDKHFKCVVRAGVGMIKGTFNFDIEWLEMDAPGHGRMQAAGRMP